MPFKDKHTMLSNEFPGGQRDVLSEGATIQELKGFVPPFSGGQSCSEEGGMLSLANPRHDVGRGALLPEFVGHKFHVGVNVLEESLVART
jgi:hypothetical protein